jgi:hypothetical protein
MGRRITFEDAARFVLGRERELERKTRPKPSLPRLKCLEQPMPADIEPISERKKPPPARRSSRSGKAPRAPRPVPKADYARMD